MPKNFCGLDFGTSNSTLGIAAGNGVALCPLEAESVTLPSAIFFDYEEHKVRFGREGIGAYIEGTEGRLMRALKSVLGSSLIDETTLVQRKRVAMRDVIGMFMRHLKARAEQHVGHTIEHVVLGRPVRFVDEDDAADAQAEAELIGIAKAQGFHHVEMQFEPVAAALAYEQSLAREELALIVDLGGGTSDFAVARLSPERARAHDRAADILGRSGVHIGGTDFDRRLSIRHVMPHLGYDALIGPKKLPMPSHLYHDLATWHRIPTLYTPQNINYLRSILFQVSAPEMIEQLIEVLVDRKGHRIAAAVEAAKIALSDEAEVTLPIPLDPVVETVLHQGDLDHAVYEDGLRIVQAIDACLRAAGVAPGAIQSVFLTGGSTAVPEIRRQVLGHLPNAKPVTGDLFGSVGLGLAIDAARKFA
ncbi:Hsp70 family protein [Dongia rigui]|uniref:Hsp70 family protein n=1 Tax=Dongia rigui TaxID=940149 RepID=A0ABU5E1W9_9PROT|nr:Hsp70 family protein [Dongia rigui]MDY0873214.1 Hsp70 family protein [Dongia rigui]